MTAVAAPPLKCDHSQSPCRKHPAQKSSVDPEWSMSGVFSPGPRTSVTTVRSHNTTPHELEKFSFCCAENIQMACQVYRPALGIN